MNVEIPKGSILGPIYCAYELNNIIIKHEQKVESFLQERDVLLDLILNARDEIVECFGPEVSVKVQYWDDPEEGHDVVAVLIGTKRNWREDWDSLQAFKERWWYAHSPAAGELVFTLDL